MVIEFGAPHPFIPQQVDVNTGHFRRGLNVLLHGLFRLGEDLRIAQGRSHDEVVRVHFGLHRSAPRPQIDGSDLARDHEESVPIGHVPVAASVSISVEFVDAQLLQDLPRGLLPQRIPRHPAIDTELEVIVDRRAVVEDIERMAVLSDDPVSGFHFQVQVVEHCDSPQIVKVESNVERSVLHTNGPLGPPGDAAMSIDRVQPQMQQLGATGRHLERDDGLDRVSGPVAGRFAIHLHARGDLAWRVEGRASPSQALAGSVSENQVEQVLAAAERNSHGEIEGVLAGLQFRAGLRVGLLLVEAVVDRAVDAGEKRSV